MKKKKNINQPLSQFKLASRLSLYFEIAILCTQAAAGAGGDDCTIVERTRRKMTTENCLCTLGKHLPCSGNNNIAREMQFTMGKMK